MNEEEAKVTWKFWTWPRVIREQAKELVRVKRKLEHAEAVLSRRSVELENAKNHIQRHSKKGFTT